MARIKSMQEVGLRARHCLLLYPPICPVQGILELDFGPAPAMTKLACHTFFYLGGMDVHKSIHTSVSEIVSFFVNFLLSYGKIS